MCEERAPAMGQATRTTTLPLDLSKRPQGGTNTGKRACLQATVEVLNAARAFYVAFFLAHPDKLADPRNSRGSCGGPSCHIQ